MAPESEWQGFAEAEIVPHWCLIVVTLVFVCRKLMKDLTVSGLNLIVCQFLLVNLCDEQDRD